MLSACATPEKWEAKISNPSPFDIAKSMCMKQSVERYPVRYTSSSQPSFSPMTINGKDIPVSSGPAFSSDANEWERRDYFNTCMRAEGWENKNKNKATGLLAFLFN